ncbi:MAG: ABC transporter permease [Bacteroidetes bacterium]|nr:ABC transporter permease [Bacteroidota bacterium]
MSALRHIIYREWITRVRRKAFILGTLAVPLLFMGSMAIGYWLEQGESENSRVLVVDVAGMVSQWDERVESWVPICPDCFPERESLTYRFATEGLDDETFIASDFDVMVVFDDAVLQHHTAMYYYEHVPGFDLQNHLKTDLSQALERFKVKETQDLDFATYQRLKTQISLVGEDIITRDGHAVGRSLIGFVFSLFLFMQILIYGMHVMRGVIEEKVNRIVEVVISVVKPSVLMTGKVIGIGLVGLTQFVALSLLIWLITLAGSAWLEHAEVLKSSSDALVGLDLQTWIAGQSELNFLLDVNWSVMLASTALFYVVGFALYAASFAAIGAAVEQEADAQYFLIPAMAPLLASYFLAVMAIENPEGTLAVVASFVPFTAPVVMLIRIPLGVAWWEIAISWLGVALTAWLLLKMAGRIYRVGILMHGKRPTWRALFKWFRHAE